MKYNEIQRLFGMPENPNADLENLVGTPVPNVEQQAPVAPAAVRQTPTPLDVPQLAAEEPTAPAPQNEQLVRLEKMAEELQKSRAKELEDASRRQMYQDILSGVNSNLGLIVGGAQAMNTKAAVQAPKAGEIKERDLVKQVSERYKTDQEALMEKYKTLLKAQQDADELAKRAVSEKEKMDRLDALEEGRDRRFYAAMANREGQQDYKKLEFAQNSFNKDKIVQKSEERVASARTLRELVTQNTPISAEAAKTFAARASGEVGALSDQDRAAYGGSKAILARIQQSMNQAVNGTLSEDNKKFMLQLSDSFEKAGVRDLQETLRKYAKQTVKRMPGMTEEEAAELIRPDLAMQQNDQPALSPKDKAALDWANKNPKDPRAAQIKAKLGM